MKYVNYGRIIIIFAMALALCGCGNKRTTKEIETVTYGIDVARYQGTIDWQEVQQSGVDFAMVRLGYRSISDGTLSEDSNARYNLQEASKAGVPLGAYYFSTAITVEEAQEEARWVAEMIAKYPITYPVTFDCEGFQEVDSRQYGMSRGERTDVALAFLKEIEKLGYEGMFYASKNHIDNNILWDVTRIEKDYKIWVAQYPAAPYPETAASSYTGEHSMWQYTTEGTVPGISQPVDLNVAYFGYDGVEPQKDKQPPEQVEPDVEALMEFEAVSEQVTAKEKTNLRNMPSQDEDSLILLTLSNGEIAERVAVSSSGWSKLLFEGEYYYAVSSYLTTDLFYNPQTPTSEPDQDGIQTSFTPVDYQVTAKDTVNLRSIPSVTSKDAEIVGQLVHGEYVACVGVSNNGWSQLTVNGETCYAVSNYLLSDADTEESESDEIQTEFSEIQDSVTPKVEVNLRSIPSVTDDASQVIATVKNGVVLTRTGINEDLGWSRVEYEGQTLYCVSQYLKKSE